ncbi:hypothetical protein MHU86_16336 [Fragilaria crotonensis]|nr:hypothetical protein MHU86_16336 [Fragilaria crotonensis]
MYEIVCPARLSQDKLLVEGDASLPGLQALGTTVSPISGNSCVSNRLSWWRQLRWKSREWRFHIDDVNTHRFGSSVASGARWLEECEPDSDPGYGSYFGECGNTGCTYSHIAGAVSAGTRRNVIKKMTKAVAGYLAHETTNAGG